MNKSLRIKNFRWWIVALIALATAINYLDRQNLPVALSEIRKSFEISAVGYGLINSFFLFDFGTMYAVGGSVIDVLGRSEERGVGKECVGTGRSRWWAEHYKKKRN